MAGNAALIVLLMQQAIPVDAPPVPMDMSCSFQLYPYAWPKNPTIEQFRELLKGGTLVTMSMRLRYSLPVQEDTNAGLVRSALKQGCPIYTHKGSIYICPPSGRQA